MLVVCLWQPVQAKRHEEALEIAQHAVQSADAVLEQLEAMALLTLFGVVTCFYLDFP